jgi:hypothetical protein
MGSSPTEELPTNHWMVVTAKIRGFLQARTIALTVVNALVRIRHSFVRDMPSTEVEIEAQLMSNDSIVHSS